MKHYFKRLARLFVILLSITSCNKDNGYNNNDIIGTWYGTHSYYNPVSGTNYQYLSITFYENYNGTLEYESPVSIMAASFTYSVSRNRIICNGFSASTYDDLPHDFILKISIEGDRLIPENRFNNFILTKDGSVETGGDGEEIIDNTSLLQKVWISDDGEYVLNLKKDYTYEEYALVSPYSNKYLNKIEGIYRYIPRNEQIILDESNFWDITFLNASSFFIKQENRGKIYFSGDVSDIPTSLDLRAMIIHHCFWSSESGRNSCVFEEDGSIRWLERDRDYNYLVADGTFTLSGNKMTCDFYNVSCEYASFKGWTHNTPCTKYYTIVPNGVREIIITDDNTDKQVILNPLYD